ncbi:hypothetical protein ABZW30_13040 [Kitasatospora sp. NPDC004669]|uniref:hypothetical protein n=1 Tax=Kitasatospora sp. NPDC004669 TaxID=3154555 RepID=UPI0033ADE207
MTRKHASGRGTDTPPGKGTQQRTRRHAATDASSTHPARTADTACRYLLLLLRVIELLIS